MEEELNQLKEKFRAGDYGQIWIILEKTFPELYTRSLPNHLYKHFDKLGDMGDSIYENPKPFCETSLSVEIFLRKELNKRLNKEEGRSNSVELKDDLTHSQTSKSEIELDSIPSTLPQKIIPFQFSYFQKSLNSIEQIIYEILFLQGWKDKKGLQKLLLFLVNVFSFGNHSISNIFLKKHSKAYTPEISNWFIHKLEEGFFNQINNEQSWEIFTKHTQLMLNADIKKEFHNKFQTVDRNEKKFGKLLLFFGRNQLTSMEQHYYLLYKYLEIESLVEIWYLLNIYGRDYPDLKKELTIHKLWHKEINEKKRRMSQGSIIHYFLGKKEVKILVAKMKVIQERIDKKIKKPVNWRTY